MSGALVLVATPIGNLSDISSRALETLRNADVIACEDTRHTRKLLTHYEIKGVKLIAVHEHNETDAATRVIERVASGERVVLVSDAGMPAISDPGERIVAAVVDAGLPVTVVPGASAVVSALAVSGLPAGRFSFEGFLPRKASDRRKLLASLSEEERTLVFYESPHRLFAAVSDLADAFGRSRRVALVRELTKIHEEVVRTTLGELAARLDGVTTKGECVLVAEGASSNARVPDEAEIEAALRELIAVGSSKRDAATRVAQRYGISRRSVYDLTTRYLGG